MFERVSLPQQGSHRAQQRDQHRLILPLHFRMRPMVGHWRQMVLVDLHIHEHTPEQQILQYLQGMERIPNPELY